jgi:hypothetical protein
VNEEAMAHWGLLRQKQTNKQYLYENSRLAIECAVFISFVYKGIAFYLQV